MTRPTPQKTGAQPQDPQLAHFRKWLRNDAVADDQIRDRVRQVSGPQPYHHNHYYDEKFFLREARKGVVKNVYGQRILYVTEEFLTGLLAGLEQEVGDAAGEIMYRCGYQWGLEDMNRLGLQVGVVGADPAGTARLMVAAERGATRWADVVLETNIHRALARRESAVVVVDTPPLTDPACGRLLAQADGVLVTLLPDLMSLRTLPAATQAVAEACAARPELEFLGLVLQRCRRQERIRLELARAAGDLVLDPQVPDDPAIQAWPWEYGPDMPEGAARLAYAQLSEELGLRLGMLSSV